MATSLSPKLKLTPSGDATKDIARARQRGYGGSDAELRAKGRQIRRAVREVLDDETREQLASAGREEMEAFLRLSPEQREFLGLSDAEADACRRVRDETIARFEAEAAAQRAATPSPTPTTPAPTPTTTRPTTPLAPEPPAPTLGWNADRTRYFATKAQLGDPNWCFAHQAEMSRVEVVDSPSADGGRAIDPLAGAGGTVNPGPVAPQPAYGARETEFDPHAGLEPMDSGYRSPDACFDPANRRAVAEWAKSVMHLPISTLPPLPAIR
jgi:hypothetical protein